MSNILRGQDSIDIIKPIAEPYEDDYVNNDTQEISEIDKQEEQKNHNEFEIKRGAEAIALMGTVAVTVNELIASSKISALAGCRHGCSGKCSGCGHCDSTCSGDCKGCGVLTKSQ